MSPTKLPQRLEAWDADDYDKGWALDVKEVREWLSTLLDECTEKDSLVAKRIKDFIHYLS